MENQIKVKGILKKAPKIADSNLINSGDDLKDPHVVFIERTDGQKRSIIFGAGALVANQDIVYDETSTFSINANYPSYMKTSSWHIEKLTFEDALASNSSIPTYTEYHNSYS